MTLWDRLGRANDVIIAVWPEYQPIYERWFMREMVYRQDRPPIWRDRLIQAEEGRVRAEVFTDAASALAHAEQLNPLLRQNLAAHVGDAVERRSLELKADKAIQSKKRLQEEEALMLAEARRRHANVPRPSADSLDIAPASEEYRAEIAETLADMPYLRVMTVDKSQGRYGRRIVYVTPAGQWSKPMFTDKKLAKIAERARIADGFGLDPGAHWGETKAAIRRMLLPRANRLLQLASVQRLLAEALARGERVLVSNGIVFWYEPDGNIGWQVKETASTRDSDGATIWKEGTILSTNHGRLVVLPYEKENGEHVRGHTKNGPRDGKALPRHPDHYVEIPFRMYEGDLMIGLFGELPYE